MRERIILHLDMDAFFASVEERDKPWLRGLPIVVGADPKDGAGRGVVSTANYAARKYGIHSAMPISMAWRLSEKAKEEGKPPAVFLTGTYHKYGETSARIMDILRRHVDALEPASIDEAYGDVSSLGSYAKARVLAAKIKKEILAKEKLTCSVGIGPNKLVAKIAAGSHKPDGLTVITPAEAQDFLDPLAAKELPGVGPKSAAVLAQHNIHTVKDLRSLGVEKLTEWFGKWGIEMSEKANGCDDSPVVEEYEIKSIGEQETFETDTRDANLLLGRLKAMCTAVATRARREGFQWKTVSITVRFHDFQTRTRSSSMSESRCEEIWGSARRAEEGGATALHRRQATQRCAKFPTTLWDAANCPESRRHSSSEYRKGYAFDRRSLRSGQLAGVAAGHTTGTGSTRALTIDTYASDAKTLELEAVRLFLPFLDARENPKKKAIRLLGVRVEHLK